MYSDKRIVAMLRKRDRRGLAWLFDKYGSNLYGLAFEILGDKDQAAELVRSSIGTWIMQPNTAERRLLYQLLFLIRKNALELKHQTKPEKHTAQSRMEMMDTLDVCFLFGVQNIRNSGDSGTLGQELRSAFQTLRNQIEGRTRLSK